MKIIHLEFKALLFLYKKQILTYYRSFNFLLYLKNLFLPPKRSKLFIFLRIVFFIFVLRLFFDVLLVIFDFYYITGEWFFKNLRFFMRIYLEGSF
jgi:hypothetical protein